MDQSEHIDSFLWKSYRSGDKKAFAAIYRVYYPKLYNYGKKFIPDNSLIEDCLQETFLLFWQNREQMKGVKEIPGYLFVSFRNRLLKNIQHHKKKAFKMIPDGQYDFELELSIDQVMINTEHIYEQRINLSKALECLTKHQKEAVFLKFYENLSYEQIAGILGITTKASYKLLARAIGELRKTHAQKLAQLLLSVLVCCLLAGSLIV